MVRTGVESGIRSTCRIVTVGQIAGAQYRGDSRYVRLKCKSGEVVLQLDVLVERLRHSDRNRHSRNIRRRLTGNLEATLDFTNVLSVLIEASPIACPDG